MEKIKSLAQQHSNKLFYILLSGGIIAAINTLCRADYNFIIYLYMIYVWQFMENARESQAQEKISSFYILCYSLLIDFIWCFYWGSKWGSLEKDSESGIHTLVLILSWIGIVVKIVVIIMIGVIEWESIRRAMPKSLQQKLNKEYQHYEDEPGD